MKSVCKSLMLSLMLGLTALMPMSAQGQSLPEPAIVVSMSNLDEQLADVKYLLTASGFKDLNFIASATIKGYTQGVDSEKNAGVLFYFNDEVPVPDFLAFVPVSDIDAMLDVVAGMAEVEDGDDGQYIIVGPDGTEIMVKQQNGYAFMSNKKAMFEDLPSDPNTELGDLPKKFNLAFQIVPQRVPESLRNQAIEMIKEGSSQTLEQMDEGLQADLQKKNLQMQMKQLEMVLEQTDELTIGMSADKDQGSLYMDVVFTGVEGSELAQKFAESKPNSPSKFSGFLMDGAAFTMNSNSRMASDDAQTYAGMIDETKESLLEEMNQEGDFSDEEFAKLEKAVTNVMDVVKQTISEGVVDAGAVVMLEGKNLNLAGGMQVADARRIENTVKDLVPMIQERVDADDKVNVDIKLNSGSHKGVNFHEFHVAIPESEEEMQMAFGEKLVIALGVAKKEIYFGVGNDPIPVIKKGMDETHSATDLQQFNIYVSPILQTVARMGGPKEVMVMADKLAEVGKDRVSAVSRLIKNGVETRFEMQDGILSLIKVGYESFQSGGFPEDDF